MKNNILKQSVILSTLIFIMGFVSCKNQATNTENKRTLESVSVKTSSKKYYELVLIWVKDPEKFQEYGQKVTPIVKKYGGDFDKMFAPSATYAEGMEQPHIVNLVHYDSKEAFDSFEKDTEFKAIKHLRTESIDMMSFRGYLEVNNPSFEKLEERIYNIELANYKAGDNSAYKKYENEGEAKMKDYGYQVEFVLDIEEQSAALVHQPDFAKISFFENEVSMTNFEKNPTHKLIEEQLYPNATENVIWISGKIHPMMIQMMNHEK